MSKGLMIGIAALLIVGAGVGAYSLLSNRSENEAARTSNTSTSSNDSMNEDGDNSVSGKLSDLLKLGQNYSCTFDHTDESGNQTVGTVYVAASGDKLRGDFTFTDSAGESYEVGVIRDDTYNYVWSPKFGGFKTQITEGDSEIFSSDDTASSVGSLEDSEVNFDCRRWSVDTALFIPPSTVEFIDTDAMMQELQVETSEAMEGLDCSVCDNVPAGPSKDQCLQALGC